MAVHVKKGDMVKVIAGDAKGKTGKILKVNAQKGTVVVEKVNLVQKHVRPSRQNPQGGRLQIEKPIHISNVLPINPTTKDSTRVKFNIDENGQKSRVPNHEYVLE